jgi:transcriptional regulator with XRE-family HTH domain
MPASQNSVSRAVRELRKALQESQQAFAHRMKTAVRTIARYETVRPPRGKMLAQLEKIAVKAGCAELATVFRQALARELGSPTHLMSPEERAWSQAICNLLRNREREDLGNIRVLLLERLIQVQRQMLAWAQAGESLSRSAEQLENDLRNLQIEAEGSALYELSAATEYRSKKEGITPEQAFAKELTPARYAKSEEEHQRLDLGKKQKTSK